MQRPLVVTALVALSLTATVAGARQTQKERPRAHIDDARERATRLAEGERLFEKSVRKDPCALLTPAMVSDALGVPADALQQQKMMGCIYAWSSDDEELRASITTMFVMKTARAAADMFKTQTRDKTVDEVQAERATLGLRVEERLVERARARGEEVSPIERGAAGIVADLATEGALRPVRFKDVPGIGDEARMNVDDGSVTVRVSNFVFTVVAYRGKKAPTLDPARALELSKRGKDGLKALTAEVGAMERAFVASTIEARQAASTKLAKAVAAAL